MTEEELNNIPTLEELLKKDGVPEEQAEITAKDILKRWSELVRDGLKEDFQPMHLTKDIEIHYVDMPDSLKSSVVDKSTFEVTINYKEDAEK